MRRLGGVGGGGGGWGIKIADVEALLATDLDIQVVVICGTNKVMEQKLLAIQKQYQSALRVMGAWSNEEVAELYSIANVLVTKPGGLTIAQALLNNLPMVLVNPLPTMEEMNEEYLVRRGLAVSAKNPEQLRQWVERLLLDKKYYQQVRERMKPFASPVAAQTAAAAIIDILPR